MRKNLWMLAVILICGSMTMFTSCSIIDNLADNNEQTVKNQARITSALQSPCVVEPHRQVERVMIKYLQSCETQ